MEIDYKLLSDKYQAEAYLLATENDQLLAPIHKSFEISLIITEMIGEALLFAAEKGYTPKIQERLDRLHKLNEFILSYDTLSFTLNRYRQHMKVAAYQKHRLMEENAQLKEKLAKYEKWEG